MKNYILSCINADDYPQNPKTEEEKVKFLYETFKTEFCFEYNLHKWTYEKCFEEWVKGLPPAFDVDINENEIKRICKAEGVEIEYLIDWFPLVTKEAFKLFEKYNLKG